MIEDFIYRFSYEPEFMAFIHQNRKKISNDEFNQRNIFKKTTYFRFDSIKIYLIKKE